MAEDPKDPSSTEKSTQATAEAAKQVTSEFEKLATVLNQIADKLSTISDLSNDVREQAEKNVRIYGEEFRALEKREEKIRSGGEALTKAEADYQLLMIGREKIEIKLKELENEKIKKIEEYNANKKEGEPLTDKEKEDIQDIIDKIQQKRIDLKKYNNDYELSIALSERRLNIEQKQKNLFEIQGVALFNQIGTTTHLADIMEAFWAGPLTGAVQLLSRAMTESIKLIDVVMTGNQQFTAATGQIAKRTADFGYGMSQFGIGFQQMNESMMGLFTSMTGFSTLSTVTQEKLAGTAAKMKNLGVDIATTGKNFDILTKTLKMSAESAIDAQDKIAKHAIATGIAPSVMLKEFSSNMPRLAGYGQQAVDIFIKLEKQAKSLGMSVQELNSIVGEQYDTFDGAALGAGKLNAILGGNYLNSIQMMNANESERIMIIKRAVDASGMQIDGMNKFQKIAIANAMGIKDLSQLTNILGKNTADLAREMEQDAASQKELEAVQREAAETQKQMTAAFQSFLIVIRPLVDLLKGFLNLFAEFMDLGNGWVGKILIWSLAIYKFGSAIKSLTMFTKLASFFMNMFGTSMTTAGAQAAAVTPVIQSTGGAAQGAAPGIQVLAVSLLELGAAIALIGVGIGVAAAGMGYFISSFKGLGDAATSAIVGMVAFGAIFAGLVIGLLFLAPKIMITGTALLYFAGAVALLGLGIGLAAAGFGSLIESVSKLSSSLSAQAVTNLTNISKAVAGLILALAGTGTLGIIGLTAGSIALAISLSMIINSINKVNDTKVVTFTNLLKTFAESLRLTGIESTSLQIATAINNISAAIDKVPESKAVNFTSTMDSINRTFSSVAQVDANKIESAKQFVDTATKYYAVQKDSKAADNDALVVAITKALSSANTGKNNTPTGAQQPVVISVEISGQQIAKALAKLPAIDGNTRG